MNLFSALSSKPTALLAVCIVLVIISILGLIGTLVTLILYKKIVEYTYESSKYLTFVDASPLIKKIIIVYRVSLQNRDNKNLEATFLILLRNYYNIFAERFVKLTTETAEMFNQNSYRPKPTLKNYMKAKRICDDAFSLLTDNTETIKNIETILEMQNVARDWYINVIEKTNNVLSLIKTTNDTANVVWSPNALNATYVNNLRLLIESASMDIKRAKYNQAISGLKEAYEIIAKLIRIIDDSEKIIYLVDQQLENKLKEIESSILQNLTSNELEKLNKTSQFNSLYCLYTNMVTSIKRNIYSLNIERAYEISENLLLQIKSFETNMKYEMLIKEFINNSEKKITNSFSALWNEIVSIKDVMNLNEAFGSVNNINSIKSKILSVEQIVKEHQKRYNNLLVEFENSKTSVQKLNYTKQGGILTDLLSKIFVSFEKLRVIRSELTTEEDILNEIESRNMSLKKILAIMEVMIAKNATVSVLKTFQEEINNGFKKLTWSEKQLKADPKIFFNRQNYNAMIDYLDSEIINFAMLRNDMASTIYLAKLAEMSLSYLNRFGGIKLIDEKISVSLARLKEENYETCLKDNVAILNHLNSQNIAVS
ncbi:hypothetical protein [Mesoplasma melaleucae]|uniref:Septation ring formation regulator n=1 Tax=Mesoplasma melaleucae TaxID=81459 RepID=A0A2K8NXK3_9MOLU|nr:hypothetical protein [Mesoplasma melaleucae]ATZ18276.1 hypothetical protein EMELA_v1c07890 [Mesoplasma melaleucae]